MAEHLKAITLAPNVWTELDGTHFQIKGQKMIRLALGERIQGVATSPPIDTEAYFLTPGYGDVPIVLGDYFGLGSRYDLAFGYPFFAMPHDDEAVTIVTMGKPD